MNCTKYARVNIFKFSGNSENMLTELLNYSVLHYVFIQSLSLHD